MNYTTLKSRIEGYFNRGDTSTKVAGWIENAESFLFREIEPSSIETGVNGTTTGDIPLPADFSRLIRLDMTYSGQVTTLDYSVQGQGYVIEGSNIRLVNEPSGSFTYDLYYSPKLTALSDSNPTNWMLDNCYDLYFYAACLEGSRALKNDGEVGRIQSILPTVLESSKSYSKRTKYPASSGLRVRLRSAV